MAAHQNGRLQEARDLYLEVLKSQPGHFDSLHLLGVIAYQSGHHQAAVELIGEAIKLRPGAAAFHANRANALLALKQWERALADYDKAVALKPDFAQAHLNRGSALQALGQPSAALAGYDRAIALAPDYAQAHNYRGTVLRELGQLRAALAAFDSAVAHQPDYAEAFANRGLILRELGKPDAALASFDRAIALKPGFADAHCNRGIVLQELGQLDAAIATFDSAIAAGPDLAEVYCNRGSALAERNALEAAIADFDRAIALKPGFADARARKLFLQATMCDWRGIEEDGALIPALGLSSGATVQPFMMLSLEDDPARHRTRSEIFTKARYNFFEPAQAALPPSASARLRIGYFSADFHSHAVMYQLIRTLELHDRAQFEVYAYSFGPEVDDALRARAKNAVDVFRDVCALSGRDIAELARSDRLDIAVDLMGYTTNARPEIFASRAAPIQISYLGYPGTLGAPFMDYLIADRVLIPEASRRHYCERIIYLPHSHMATDNTKAISRGTMTRREAGLPEDGFVFCCFNSSYKIGPADFDLWMRLLSQVENSVFWLVRGNSSVQRNLEKEASKRGIAPARLVFAERVPMADHLARYRLADLFLDTLHYTGHATAADALWAGLPLVAKLGEGFPARVAASLLHAIGLPELVADSIEDYERLALELARNPQKLASVKAALEARRMTAPLFDSKGFVRHLEDAYRRAYAGHQAGSRPQIIEAV